MLEDLKDKVALVVGSSAGIGEATVILFARYGCKVVVHGRNEERIARVAAKCEEVSPFGYKPLTVKAELGNLDEIKSLVSQTIDHYQKIDIAIVSIAMKEGALSGGILDPGIMQAMEVTFNRIRAATYLCHLLLPPLLETKGSMIIVSSVAATTPIYGGGASLSYYMCDAAFDMLSKTLACEFGSKGVRVNTVNPGMVDTPSNFTLLDYEVAKKYVEEGAQKSAIGKIIPPEDVAKSIAFLASSASAFITGHSLVVDGGLIYK